MNKSGVRSAVRVIRLEALARKPPVVPPRSASGDEPEPDWSSLPSVTWPAPIGSVGARASSEADGRELLDDDGMDGSTVPAAWRADGPMPFGTAGSPRPAVAPPAVPRKMPRLPDGVVTSWPMRFHGSGAEYARLWLANVLLVVLTAGLYLPWARVRTERYLMRHTQVAGHMLDYHEPAVHLWPRYLLNLCLVGGVVGAWAGSPLAGMLALSLALAAWPLLVFMTLTHRLAHVSWARRRLAFDGRCADVYRAMWLPLAAVGALTWALKAVVAADWSGAWPAWGAAVAVWLLAMPTFVWSWYVFRQRHLRLGPLHLLWRATRPAVRMLFLRTLAWTVLTSAFSFGIAAVLLGAMLLTRGRLSLTVQTGLVLAAVVSVCAAVQPYAQARLQNLLWNKSGNRYLRFRSKLSVSAYVLLQCRHALLLVLTLGLYWPWAVVASRRMRTQAVTVWSRVDADVLKAHWPPHGLPEPGKMAGSPARPRR